MRQVFIEGTDEQYSIREDGVVISHYFNTKHKIKYYRELILKNRLDKSNICICTIGKKILIMPTFMLKMFSDIKYKKGYHKIIYKDNNSLNCNVNNLDVEFKYKKITGLDRVLTSAEASKRYYNTDKGLKKKTERGIKWRINNKSIIQEYNKNIVKNMSRLYISRSLKIPNELMTDEIYLIAKKNLLLKREFMAITTPEQRRDLRKQLNNL